MRYVHKGVGGKLLFSVSQHQLAMFYHIQNTIQGNLSTWKACNKAAKEFRKHSIVVKNWERKVQRRLLKGTTLELALRRVK